MFSASNSQSAAVLRRSDGAQRVGFDGVTVAQRLGAMTFASKAALESIGAELAAALLGQIVKTSEYHENTGFGGADYKIKERAQHRIDIGDPAWVPNTFTSFYVGGGSTLVAVINPVNGQIYDKQCGPLCDGSNDAPAIKAGLAYAGLNKIGFVFTGGYSVGDVLTVDYPQVITGCGQPVITVLDSHTGTAFRIQTNAAPKIDGNIKFIRQTVGAVGSRVGVGFDIFGNIAAGSSVQCIVKDLWFEGFAIGSKYAGCFNSDFYSLTFKRCDVNYLFLNDTNNSLRFFGCRANNLCRQHIVADPGLPGVGLDTSGATFFSCEFENADMFPCFHVKSGTNFWFDFYSCYTFENNTGTAPGSDFMAAKFDVAGRWHMHSTPWRSSLKADSRLCFGRRNASLAPWDIMFNACELKSARVTAGADFDLDINYAAGDKISILPTCAYINGSDPDHDVSPYASQYTLLREDIINYIMVNRVKLLGFDNDTELRAFGNHVGLSNNGLNSWQKGHLVFRNGVNSVHVWADTAGKLRIKVGADPTNDTDGSVVGAQS